MRPPVKWHGGKYYLAKRIIELFPPHRVYLEPFGGAASVLLNKNPVDVETYNDIDLKITRLFRVLRDRGDEFIQRMSMTPYSQAEFKTEYPDNATDVEMAAYDFVRWRQSFGGRGTTWSYTTSRARGGMAGDVNAWWTSIEMLPEIIDRIKRVQIICQSAFDAIPRFDHPEGLIYCDPPYVHKTRTSTNTYHTEMTDKDHCMLSEILHKCDSSIVLSGYQSDLYNKLYKNWNCVKFDIANHASGSKTKTRKTECLWVNF